MKGGGSGNADSLNLIEKVSVMIERLGSVSFRNLPGTRGIDIYHPHQFHPFELSIFFCVELAKVPDTNDTNLDFFHLTADPPLRTLDEFDEMLNFYHLSDLILSHLFQCFLQRQAGAKNDAVGLLQSPQGLL
jgi:hypothetical protein